VVSLLFGNVLSVGLFFYKYNQPMARLNVTVAVSFDLYSFLFLRDNNIRAVLIARGSRKIYTAELSTKQ
jgi:hypothetical protein